MKYLLIAPLMALLTMSACASMPVTFGHSAPWEHRQFTTTLPAPFGVVQISIATDDVGNTTAFRIKTDVGVLALPDEILKQLPKVSEPQITFGKAKESKPAKIRKFSVHMEIGEMIYSEKYQSSHKNIAGWDVDESMTLRDFEVVDFR